MKAGRIVGIIQAAVRIGPLGVLRRITYRAFCRVHKLDLADATHAQTGITEYDGVAHSASGGVDLAEAYIALGLQGKISSVLDIGSGKGGALIAFHRLGIPRLHGVELSKTIISTCESNLRKLGIVADVKQMHAVQIASFAPFDLIYTFNTMPRHHLRNLLHSIRKGRSGL